MKENVIIHVFMLINIQRNNSMENKSTKFSMKTWTQLKLAAQKFDRDLVLNNNVANNTFT